MKKGKKAAAVKSGNRGLMEARQNRKFSGGYGSHAPGERRLRTRGSQDRREIALYY